MRLISVHTLKLEEFVGSAIPPYAILSHTWGSHEITFQDMHSSFVRSKAGFTKIKGVCRLVREEYDHLKYVWVDTCCIDKSSSAELSEAINSMFEWYFRSGVCIAFLSDLDSRSWLLHPRSTSMTQLGNFVAPERHWRITSSTSHTYHISLKTLQHPRPNFKLWLWDLPALTKMSWAAGRKTTRVEDEAYCLLGLFDVNMPLLYGEGDKAFIRLQEEILRRTGDLSVLAWKSEERNAPMFGGVLARSASDFAWAWDLRNQRRLYSLQPECAITNRGLRLNLSLLQYSPSSNLDADSDKDAKSPPYFQYLSDINTVLLYRGIHYYGIVLWKSGPSSYCRDFSSPKYLRPVKYELSDKLGACPEETAYLDISYGRPAPWLRQAGVAPPTAVNKVYRLYDRPVGVHFPLQPDLDSITVRDLARWDASNHLVVCSSGNDYAWDAVLMRPNRKLYHEAPDIVVVVLQIADMESTMPYTQLCILDATSTKARLLLENADSFHGRELEVSPQLALDFIDNCVRTENGKWDVQLLCNNKVIQKIALFNPIYEVKLLLFPVGEQLVATPKQDAPS